MFYSWGGMLKVNMGNLNSQMLERDFKATREHSLKACETLELEDYGLQAAVFASPPKWHLAHTSWFFETFILKPFARGYRQFHPGFETLFNSYYNGIGQPFPRAERGLLSRPNLSQVLSYRRHVDSVMTELLSNDDHPHGKTITQRCRLGIEHEKQHQELLHTDIKYSLSRNPLYPAFRKPQPENPSSVAADNGWCDFSGGLRSLGVNDSPDEFAFDNEMPEHKVFVEPFSLATRLVTNREYQAFVDDGGYRTPTYWLADGWATVQAKQWSQPLYWLDLKGNAMEFTLYGLQERQPDQPVCHLSGYEADAYANWANARLPTEAEWEVAARQQTGSMGAAPFLHPRAATRDESSGSLLQLYDSCWQWTASAYRAYPGFKIQKGAIGEYNGKFMSSQWVLRGGSCVSSAGHLRPTYRNFFYPEDRWQFSGIRLAKNT